MANNKKAPPERRGSDRRTKERRDSNPDLEVIWSDKFATGIRAIDSDHQNLFEEVKILKDRLERGADAKAVGNAIHSLESYCADHFAREEQFMEKAHYPDFKDHRKEHKRFAKLVKQLGKLHNKNPDQIDPQKVLKFIISWLTGHIIGVDLKYVPYVSGDENGQVVVNEKEVVSAPLMETVTFEVPQPSLKILKEFHKILTEGGYISDALVQVVEQLRKKRNKALKKNAIKLFCKKEEK